MKIILASSSPRRSQILKDAGFTFEVLKIDVDESFSPDLAAEGVPLFLAKKKMDEAKKIINDDDSVIITADTVVILGNRIIGKPADETDAFRILKALSGNMHWVISAVCISMHNQQFNIEATTKVYFEEVSDEEINFYLQNFKPYDKAGAYAIQEWIGINKISKIEGDYYNVVGFPMSKIYPVLLELIKEN